MLIDTNKICVACGSKKIIFGYLGTSANSFVPVNIFTIYGYRTRAFVCQDCGYVSQFLSKEKLEKLNRRVGEREELEE